MNREDLAGLVRPGESERVEFKRSTGDLKGGMQSACAMLNGSLPGHVLFGVGDDGSIVGQDVSTKTLEDIARELRLIEPPAFPDVETIALDHGKAVIVLIISGGTGLYSYDGRPYQRIGPTTSRMPVQVYEHRLLERMHASSRWENQTVDDFSIDDLDLSELNRTIEEAIRRQRLDDPGTRSPSELLMGLGLMAKGDLLNAAVVLFGQADRLMPRYPQCLLRMARFRGSTKTEFIDNRREIGNAFDLLVRAQRFLRDHLPVAGRIVPSLFERVDDPLYPPEALREALANALCHRDYSVSGGSVSIAIYDDRLEISSTGSLPFGLTPEALTRPHQSLPWNPLIAQSFFRRGIIETWGRGTLKMMELTEQAGLTAPEFESGGGEVVVRFHPTRYIAPTRVAHDLSPLQRELMQVLEQVGPAPLSVIMAQLAAPTPRRTVQDNLRILRLFDLVDTSGKGSGARWMLKGVQLWPAALNRLLV